MRRVIDSEKFWTVGSPSLGQFVGMRGPCPHCGEPVYVVSRCDDCMRFDSHREAVKFIRENECPEIESMIPVQIEISSRIVGCVSVPKMKKKGK